MQACQSICRARARLRLAKVLFTFLSWLAKRVVSWSSLDWDRSRWIQIDLVLGTMFDVAIHAMNSVLLFPYISTTEGSVTNSE